MEVRKFHFYTLRVPQATQFIRELDAVVVVTVVVAAVEIPVEVL